MSTLSVFDAAREAPGALALLDGETELSFAELAEQTWPFAAALQRERPRALALVARAEPVSLRWLYAAFATGTPVLTLHARSSELERKRACDLAGASGPPALHDAERPRALAPVASTQALVLIPTSGSSGTPRLVELSRAAVQASAEASAANLGWQADDVWLLCLPLAHAGGLSIVTRTLLARKPLSLLDAGSGGALANIDALARACARATLISLVPSQLAALLDAGFRGAPGLRAVLLGGAACAPALARRAHAAGLPLLTSYGLTETASQVVTRRYAERYEPLPERQGRVSSGHPLPGVELELRRAMVAVRAPSLLTRYVGDAAAALDPAGWLLTGDRGELGPSGELYVRGRADDVIVTGGENVDPLEVEAALLELSGIRAACVFGAPSAQFGQLVAAAIVTDEPELATPEALARALQHRLARFKHPRRVVRAETLPLTPSGKLDRRACAARWAPGRAE